MNINEDIINSKDEDHKTSCEHHPLQGWEKETLEKLLFSSLKEQKASRRWKIFFRFLAFGYLIGIYILFSGVFHDSESTSRSHTALININGIILSGKPADADNIIGSLKDAFNDQHTKGIILRINSPGGSPVQVSNISEEVFRQRKLHPKIKVYAVCSDICASGGYWIAAAADEIYANPASLVGSIGVVMEGFGFVDAMKKWGVERRLITAGEHKGLLDSFSPLKKEEVAFAQNLLFTVHQQFIHYIVKQRGNRLKIEKDTFSGLAWSGEDALRMGLIDGYGSEEYVARNVIKEDKIVDYTLEPSYFERISNQLGSTFANTVIQQFKNMEVH